MSDRTYVLVYDATGIFPVTKIEGEYQIEIDSHPFAIQRFLSEKEWDVLIIVSSTESRILNLTRFVKENALDISVVIISQEIHWMTAIEVLNSNLAKKWFPHPRNADDWKIVNQGIQEAAQIFTLAEIDRITGYIHPTEG